MLPSFDRLVGPEAKIERVAAEIYAGLETFGRELNASKDVLGFESEVSFKSEVLRLGLRQAEG